jgi:Nitrile hydratase beta subunit
MTDKVDPAHRHHDCGGQPAGVCDLQRHEREQWERRIDALMVLLSQSLRAPGAEGSALLRVDQIRRQIESLGPDAYGRMGYYERWTHAISATLLELGVLSSAELAPLMSGIGQAER